MLTSDGSDIYETAANIQEITEIDGLKDKVEGHWVSFRPAAKADRVQVFCVSSRLIPKRIALTPGPPPTSRGCDPTGNQITRSAIHWCVKSEGSASKTRNLVWFLSTTTAS